MKDTSNVKISTDRLALVPISLDYLDDIFCEFTSDISTYMFPQPSGNIQDTKEFIEESLKEMKEGNNLQLIATDPKTGEFFGCIGLHHIDKRDPEMGVWLKKGAHGKRYGQEAMHAVKQWADEHLDYEYIKYPVAMANVASRKIPESLGGKVVREFVGKRQDGEEMNEVEYRIYKKLQS